jgi:sensor c-di-GMP phosphodiesterase-like protein
LRDRGVDQAQGWYYSRAMPADEFIEFVRHFNAALADTGG